MRLTKYLQNDKLSQHPFAYGIFILNVGVITNLGFGLKSYYHTLDGTHIQLLTDCVNTCHIFYLIIFCRHILKDMFQFFNVHLIC